MRYEDVVVRPDEVRRQLARLLGAESERTVAADEVVLSWEWWKQRANRPVEADRAERWRSVLPPGTADVVVAVAGPTMKRFGYAPGQPPTAARLRAVVCVPRRRHFRRAGRAHLTAINLTDLEAGGEPVRPTGRSRSTRSSRVPTVREEKAER